MRNPAVYKRAHAELKAAWPSLQTRLSVLELERLHFLDACIKEGLRMSCPAPLRMPRIVGPEGYEYDGHFLPAGVSRIHKHVSTDRHKSKSNILTQIFRRSYRRRIISSALTKRCSPAPTATIL